MKNIEELLFYDDMGIVPLPEESERTFLKRIKNTLSEQDSIAKDILAIGYSSAESEKAGLDFLVQQTAVHDNMYATLQQRKTEAAFFTGIVQNKFPYLRLGAMLPLAAIAEHLMFGTTGMGVALGLLINRIGVHSYHYLSSGYKLAKYQQWINRRNEIGTTISSLYPTNAAYILERLDDDDKIKLSTCMRKEDVHRAIEQRPGLKWEIIRERLRRDSIKTEEHAQHPWITGLFLGTKSIFTGLLATFCSSALFFETTFAYRDYVIGQRGLKQGLLAKSDALVSQMEKANNIHLDMPTISVGYRALHRGLIHEVQKTMETNVPVLKLPVIRQMMMVYYYTGGGFGTFMNISGLYVPDNEIVVVGKYYGEAPESQEIYTTIHELGHHYVNSTNPKLLSYSLSKEGFEYTVFHEGLAEYLALKTCKNEGLVQYHRCIYAADVAQAMAGNGKNLFYHKSHHYPIGYCFVDYVLSEVGAEHLNTLIKTPPRHEDFFNPESYVINLKRKLGQRLVINHPEKNPARMLENYIMR